MTEHSIIQLIDRLLVDAVQRNVSDLHFEPYDHFFRLRIRQDGILQEVDRFPLTLAPQVSSRLKVMSRLDIAERRMPQDGRFKIELPNGAHVDVRISTCPTLFGEKIALRILNPTSMHCTLEELGYERFQEDLFLKAIYQSQGLCLVTGPTGSGKTRTLYTALQLLNTQARNISSCEDPVEIQLPGINQVNIHVKAGLTFANTLRAFLRQDPDVIMIGEIRDLETADIAIQAAHTGHLVLSTVHTNSASDTLTRLINMGIPSYNLATAISLIIAQRLIRKLCEVCKVPVACPPSILLEAGFTAEEHTNLILYGPKGCVQCQNGYRGRVGIYELLPINTAFSQLIMDGVNSLDLYHQALKAGFWDLKRACLHKIKQGVTSLEEFYRVIQR